MPWLNDDPQAEAERARYREANGHDNTGESAPLEYTVASTLAGIEPPPRPWLVPDWIPRRQVTLLSGDGGVGKSLIAMQLMVAAASGGQWLGMPTARVAAFGVFAEDDDNELHRRLLAVAKTQGTDVACLDNMAWRCAVSDLCELIEVDRQGSITPTTYFRRLEAAIRLSGSRLIALDAATNLYGGDEIARRQVNGYIGMLRRLAIEIDGAIVLLAHPSSHGIASGSGLSGSTHWHNAVRSRLYFVHPKGDGGEPDPDERELQRPKANYAGGGAVLRLRWQDGAFVPMDEPGSVDRAAVNAKAERVFLSLLQSTYGEGTWVCPNPAARNYAPSLFGKHPDREGLGKPAFEAAMRRILSAERAKIETYGRPSEPRRRLALA